MLSATFALSEQNNWNERLKDRGSQRFTLFVPSNDAWEYIHRNIPSGYKKLFMGGYAYQGKAILERHMIVGKRLEYRRTKQPHHQHHQTRTLTGAPQCHPEARSTSRLGSGRPLE
ncbi:hypothetical protein Pcinc_037938, partial [Petrolisthes cinctipes]